MDSKEAAENTNTGLTPTTIPQFVKTNCMGCNKIVSGFLIPDGRFICPNCHPEAVFDRWQNELSTIEDEARRTSIKREKIAQKNRDKRAVVLRDRVKKRVRSSDIVFTTERISVYGSAFLILFVMLAILSNRGCQKSIDRSIDRHMQNQEARCDNCGTKVGKSYLVERTKGYWICSECQQNYADAEESGRRWSHTYFHGK